MNIGKECRWKRIQSDGETLIRCYLSSRPPLPQSPRGITSRHGVVVYSNCGTPPLGGRGKIGVCRSTSERGRRWFERHDPELIAIN